MASQATASTKDSRRLVFSDGSSNKFWHIELDGSSHTVHFGRVGTAGQTQTKDFGDEAAARNAYDKLVDEKLKKGYVDDSAAGSAAPGAAPASVAKPAKPKPAAKKETAAGDIEVESSAIESAMPVTPAPAARAAAAPLRQRDFDRPGHLHPPDRHHRQAGGGPAADGG